MPTDRFDIDDAPEDAPPLFFERVRRLAAPVAILLAALLVVSLGSPTPRRLGAVVVLAAIAIVIYARNRGDDDRDYGPGSDV